MFKKPVRLIINCMKYSHEIIHKVQQQRESACLSVLWIVKVQALLYYYSWPCGYSHDGTQPIGISAPVVDSVQVEPQSLLRWLTDSPFSTLPAQQHWERHGNGEETGGQGVVRGWQFNRARESSSSSSTISTTEWLKKHTVWCLDQSAHTL